jgi:SAM-dependent methyltransferase
MGIAESQRAQSHWNDPHFRSSDRKPHSASLDRMNKISESKGPAINAIKARQKATWESGDFGQVARFIVVTAEEFMARLNLKPAQRVLDVACGTGNLAVVAARRGCRTSGVDIAANLIAQARERARVEKLEIEFTEGDAEALPYPDGHFDVVATMFGAMFAPRPELVAAELCRVTRPGGFIAMANWTPEGFIGKMFEVFKKHLPPSPPGVPPPILWGDESTARARLGNFADVRTSRRIATFQYPFPPAETVDFFRRYYGPTVKAFDSLNETGQQSLRDDLVSLQTAHNTSTVPDATETHAEYLEVIARR